MSDNLHFSKITLKFKEDNNIQLRKLKALFGQKSVPP